MSTSIKNSNKQNNDKAQSEKIENKTEETEAETEVDAEAEADEDEDEDEVEADDEIEEKKSKKAENTYDSLTSLNDIIRIDSEIESLLRNRKFLFKLHQRNIIKESKKIKKRRSNTSDTNKEPTGFVKAIPIPSGFESFYKERLIDNVDFRNNFVNFDINSNMPRTEITRMIYSYIRSNELYGTKGDGSLDKRNIIPDEYLSRLLEIKEGENIGFNNFQSYVTRMYNVDKLLITDDSDNEEVSVEVVNKKKAQIANKS
jgi:chromatin remodeling complex protein RSC6